MYIKKFYLSLITISAVLVLASSILAGEPPTTPRRLSDTEISQQLPSLSGWTIENQQLRRTYQFKNFVESIDFVNRLVEPAEKAGHHPDIVISYNQVTISLTTHDAGGLTQKDFDLAEIISQLSFQSK